MFFRQEWEDPRLKFYGDAPLFLGEDLIQNVWVPDTYFENEKLANYHEMTRKNTLLRVESNGHVFYSIR